LPVANGGTGATAFSTQYADDAAAATGGIAVGGMYARTTGEIAIRLA